MDGRLETVEILARTSRPTTLSLLPFPVRGASRPVVRLTDGKAEIVWPDAPERPRGNAEPVTNDEKAAHALFLRARSVWDRISDVDTLLADPARLWTGLRARWTGSDAGEPQMDVIVRHARKLSRTIETLLARPRRILRRVHRQTPVGRVQEVDRRSMLWLARQPGETLAERAGDDQRILAVAREENYDTLENRVLRAYGELAARHGQDYLARNRTKRHSIRALQVERFAKTCLRMARDLAERGVRSADAGVTPNFVLQQNPGYHEVWVAWGELLHEKRRDDDLWRWQARSWEEYCSLALLVAMAGLPGARPVATAPIWYRDEHHRGKWIEADSPLGVMYLPGRGLLGTGLIVELQRGHPGGDAAQFGAPIWLRIGRVGETQGFLTHVPVWPMWSPVGGLSAGEATEVAGVVSRARQLVRGGVVMRPATGPEKSEAERADGVLALTLGTEGAALRDALAHVTDHLAKLFDEVTA